MLLPIKYRYKVFAFTLSEGYFATCKNTTEFFILELVCELLLPIVYCICCSVGERGKNVPVKFTVVRCYQGTCW